jgi:hypothetical protein
MKAMQPRFRSLSARNVARLHSAGKQYSSPEAAQRGAAEFCRALARNSDSSSRVRPNSLTNARLCHLHTEGRFCTSPRASGRGPQSRPEALVKFLLRRLFTRVEALAALQVLIRAFAGLPAFDVVRLVMAVMLRRLLGLRGVGDGRGSDSNCHDGEHDLRFHQMVPQNFECGPRPIR